MPASLQIDLLTLFPGILDGFLEASMVGRARKNSQLAVAVHNIRDWASDKHLTTDERPFGGGAGMVMKPEPTVAAIEAVRRPGAEVIYLSPDGEPLTSSLARHLAGAGKPLVLLSGHYEGLDQRVRDGWVDREVSIGDYILTNGTLAAAVLIDAMVRYVPGVLGDENSLTQDAFNDNLLSFPQFTRPPVFRDRAVPEILFSGNHAAIAAWRREQQREKTRRLRPDLLPDS
ncbi:MAG: tRNA (guanosine(37)-N1)-methyltransferase TrmD [Opitutales bacterium]